MLKKMMALTVALAMAFSLCACCMMTEAPAASNTQPVQRPDVQIEEPTPTAAPEVESAAFAMGTVSNNRYENTFAGIACSLDSDWYFMNEDEIKELNGITADMAGQAFIDAISNANVVQDMYATAANQMDTVNVVFEKLENSITAETYATMSVGGLISGLENMGMEDLSYEIDQLWFAGEEQVAIFVSGVYADIAVYETLVITRCDGYIMVTTACSWYENITEDILANFTAI